MTPLQVTINGLCYDIVSGEVACDCCHDSARGVAFVCTSHPDESFALCQACDRNNCEPDGVCGLDGSNAPGYPDGVADAPFAENH